MSSSPTPLGRQPPPHPSDEAVVAGVVRRLAQQQSNGTLVPPPPRPPVAPSVSLPWMEWLLSPPSLETHLAALSSPPPGLLPPAPSLPDILTTLVSLLNAPDGRHASRWPHIVALGLRSLLAVPTHTPLPHVAVQRAMETLEPPLRAPFLRLAALVASTLAGENALGQKDVLAQVGEAGKNAGETPLVVLMTESDDVYGVAILATWVVTSAVEGIRPGMVLGKDKDSWRSVVEKAIAVLADIVDAKRGNHHWAQDPAFTSAIRRLLGIYALTKGDYSFQAVPPLLRPQPIDAGGTPQEAKVIATAAAAAAALTPPSSSSSSTTTTTTPSTTTSTLHSLDEIIPALMDVDSMTDASLTALSATLTRHTVQCWNSNAPLGSQSLREQGLPALHPKLKRAKTNKGARAWQILAAHEWIYNAILGSSSSARTSSRASISACLDALSAFTATPDLPPSLGSSLSRLRARLTSAQSEGKFIASASERRKRRLALVGLVHDSSTSGASPHQPSGSNDNAAGAKRFKSMMMMGGASATQAPLRELLLRIWPKLGAHPDDPAVVSVADAISEGEKHILTPALGRAQDPARIAEQSVLLEYLGYVCDVVQAVKGTPWMRPSESGWDGSPLGSALTALGKAGAGVAAMAHAGLRDADAAVLSSLDEPAFLVVFGVFLATGILSLGREVDTASMCRALGVPKSAWREWMGALKGARPQPGSWGPPDTHAAHRVVAPRVRRLASSGSPGSAPLVPFWAMVCGDVEYVLRGPSRRVLRSYLRGLGGEQVFFTEPAARRTGVIDPVVGARMYESALASNRADVGVVLSQYVPSVNKGDVFGVIHQHVKDFELDPLLFLWDPDLIECVYVAMAGTGHAGKVKAQRILEATLGDPSRNTNNAPPLKARMQTSMGLRFLRWLVRSELFSPLPPPPPPSSSSSSGVA